MLTQCRLDWWNPGSTHSKAARTATTSSGSSLTLARRRPSVWGMSSRKRRGPTEATGMSHSGLCPAQAPGSVAALARSSSRRAATVASSTRVEDPSGRGLRWSGAVIDVEPTSSPAAGTWCVCGCKIVPAGTSCAFGDRIPVPDGVECPRLEGKVPGRVECPPPAQPPDMRESPRPRGVSPAVGNSPRRRGLAPGGAPVTRTGRVSPTRPPGALRPSTPGPRRWRRVWSSEWPWRGRS